MPSIILDKELGVNPKLTYCTRCGGDADELMLIGNKKTIVECPSCGVKCYGGKPNMQGKCSSCGGINRYWDRVGTIQESDRLPASEPCTKCRNEIVEQQRAVEAGGIYWRCADCHATGVLKKSPFADVVREAHGLTNGEPCGVEFIAGEEPACPVCGGNHE